MSMLDRRLARGALVLVGAALCLFGPSRLAAAGYASDGHTGATAVVSGSASNGSDHATAPRSPISLLDGLHSVVSGSVVLIVATALVWTLVVANRRRVTVTPLPASWRRRGPPLSLG